MPMLVRVIIWLNGTFGAGKTTTSNVLADAIPDARIFDAEHVGFLLRPLLASVPVRDFQDWQPWRNLVVDVAVQALGYAGGTLVIPQTVLVEQYWDEIAEGLAEAQIPVLHIVLHANRATITQRIEADAVETEARQWRLDHLQDYERALPWLERKGHILDTTTLVPVEVAAEISRRLTGRDEALTR